VTISIITPVFNPTPAALGACIRSVVSQSHTDWEWCLVDDGSTAPHVMPTLDALASNDRRVSVTRRTSNGGIAVASNDALAMATGEFVALLDHDDMLHADALDHVARRLASEPDLDYLYTDEDHVDPDDHHVGAFYKPDWSPERLRSQMYTCHLSVFRRSLVCALGGFREGFDGAQDYDLVLRVTEHARAIAHVPEVLYHWRMGAGSTSFDAAAKPWAYQAGCRAVQDHCDRVGIDAVVEQLHVPGCHRVRRTMREHPLVSVILPSRGATGRVYGLPRTFVVEAVRDLVERTTYRNLEIVVVLDRAAPHQVARDLVAIAGRRLKLVWYDRPFNFSEKINMGAVVASGQQLLLLNDDIEVITPDWVDVMVALLADDDVAMVGARLLFADGTLQHAGHVYSSDALHIFSGRSPHEAGPSGLLQIEREVSGVTGACALVRAEPFHAAGGLSLDLAVNFNDVDLSLKLRLLGYRIVWTPHATLYHFESQTRTRQVSEAEVELLNRRWGHALRADPYHNPNLEPGRDDWMPKRDRGPAQSVASERV
jgi:GT2 family glycosyltransferase